MILIKKNYSLLSKIKNKNLIIIVYKKSIFDFIQKE